MENVFTLRAEDQKVLSQKGRLGPITHNSFKMSNGNFDQAKGYIDGNEGLKPVSSLLTTHTK